MDKAKISINKDGSILEEIPPTGDRFHNHVKTGLFFNWTLTMKYNLMILKYLHQILAQVNISGLLYGITVLNPA